MRIALVALHYAEYSARLALALARHHSVLLILRTDNAHEELSIALREALADNVQLVLIEHRMLRQPSVVVAALRLVKIVRSFNPDVVHFQEYPVDYAAWSALRLMALYPSVLTIHDHVYHSGVDSKVPLRSRLYQKFLRSNTKKIIVHGESIRETLLLSGERPSLSIVSIKHGVLGVDYPRISSVPPDFNKLLFFGRIEAYKGLSVLLDALDRLDSQTWGAVNLLIAGRGSDLNAQRERIAKKPHIEIDERFIPVEDVPALFSQCAITVLPYLDATQSGVAAMAFAFGRPVIASATGALSEVVQEGKTGLLVPPADANSLAQAIRRLTTDRTLWNTLAHGAEHCASGDLSWINIAEKTTSVYEELA
jgi:glycosyltransferase involved in cell wall biosynthesis